MSKFDCDFVNGVLCVCVCVCFKYWGFLKMGFGVCVIAVLGLHVFSLVASAARPGECAYHEFWIPASPGAMVLGRVVFIQI